MRLFVHYVGVLVTGVPGGCVGECRHVRALVLAAGRVGGDHRGMRVIGAAVLVVCGGYRRLRILLLLGLKIYKREVGEITEFLSDVP